MTMLPGRYYNFHFIDEETGSKKLSHFPQVSYLEGGRVSHILKPMLLHSPHSSREAGVATCIHSFNKYLSSTYYVPGTVLSTRV